MTEIDGFNEEIYSIAIQSYGKIIATGSAWTQNGSVNSTFIGINVDGLTTSLNTIENNTIANMSWICNNNSTASAPGIFCGIRIINGGATVLTNTIGSGTGTGSISVTSLTSGAGSFGIAHTGSSGVITISNNTIGAVTVIGSATINHSFTGITISQAGAGNIRTISDNTIGSLITSNSINAFSFSISAALSLQTVTGITITNSSNQLLISGNTVANLNNNYSGTGAGQVIGIDVSYMVTSSTITGNTVRNLTNTSASTSIASSASVVGISFTATSFDQYIRGNHVYSLLNNHASAAVSVTGIFYRPVNGTGGTNYFDGNFVHSLVLSPSSTAASINGIFIGNTGSNLGTTHFTNNVIDLGLDASGAGINTGYTINGFNEVAGTDNYNFNSVYIGGCNGSTNSSSLSAAFISTATANSTREISNNIFFNARSNNNAAGFNYAMRFANLTNTNSNYNDLYVTGTNGIIGYNGTANQNPLATRTSTTRKDANSITSNPLFVNSGEGVSAIIIDLRIPQASLANKAGGIIANITTFDYNGLTRNSFTPIDMGAFAEEPSVLSVQLVSFIAELYNQTDALLQWITASEINSDYFLLEVMDEKIDTFREIGKIKSSGTSVNSHQYNFIDAEENKIGIRYYRIKEVDAFGKAVFSQVRKVVFEPKMFLISEPYPDPAHDFTFIKLMATEENNISVTILRNDGKIISRHVFLLSTGENELHFNLSGYQNGLYTLLISDFKSGKFNSKKILKM